MAKRQFLAPQMFQNTELQFSAVVAELLDQTAITSFALGVYPALYLEVTDTVLGYESLAATFSC